MANQIKGQDSILNKLNIDNLNPMQEEALATIKNNENTIILSPTGTGKTLAFLLPVINDLDPDCQDIQALILVPSRELAIQIEQVVREMGSGFKVNAVYGGRSMSKDKVELKHAPAILIGTPGRIADHFGRERFSKENIKTLVLDEFDKSLETGFEYEMRGIINELPNVHKRILTSATQEIDIPDFVKLEHLEVINYLDQGVSNLEVKTVVSPSRNKLNTLVDLLSELGDQPGIVFCNLKDTIKVVSDFLFKNKINHGCFYGGMEQKDRERSLIKFRNGTHQIIVATDLAARGIDIPEIKFIIHYQLPLKVEEFTHRNGRTARVNAEGTAYVLKAQDERLPEFIQNTEEIKVTRQSVRSPQYWQTLFISGGRKDKISKGDIAGLFFKQGKINKDQLGIIELKQDCTFVAVPIEIADELVKNLNNSRLKKKKVRIAIV
ncbi:helicase [Aquimarina aggregata]|uniref:Helicase n=1 Tax=Aquimarina aggregata TaxID=1642818 RepID=A0A163CF65_9FLAO|nr:DEAD/DEAH box helicase [Aquimarina aggregata]KZS42350.1 helicase [Aquimarina aggregata]